MRGVVSVAATGSVFAADVTGQVTVTGLTQVSSTRVGRTLYEYTYRVNLTNTGGALSGVTATVASSAPGTQIMDGTVVVGDLGGGAGTTPTDTITIRHDRTVAFNRAALTWSFDGSSTSEVDGVLLTGNPKDNAVDSLVQRIGETPAASDIVNALITTRLLAVIDPSATVEDVNNALNLVGAKITAMTPGDPLVDIGIAAVSDASEGEAIAQQLRDTGVFLSVEMAYSIDDTTVLPPSIGGAIGGNFYSYLDVMRAPAMWNARDWISLQRSDSTVQVAVADVFYPGSHEDLTIDFVGNPTDSGNKNHGWHVSGVIGAHFDGQDGTGIHPLHDQLKLTGIRYFASGDTWRNKLTKIASNLPETGSFVLNTSLAYNDWYSVRHKLPRYSDYDRAIWAIKWRELVAGKQDRFVHATAAGNDNQDIPDFPSTWSSPFTTAARRPNPCEIMSTSDPLLAACNSYYNTVITSKSVPMLTNVIAVGSLAPFGLDQLSVFSDRGEDVAAVGEDVFSLCIVAEPPEPNGDGCPGPNSLIPLSGTSMATPQVAGVAALVWTLDSSLTVSEIANIIKNSSNPIFHSASVIDGYRALLAVDNRTPPLLGLDTNLRRQRRRQG